MLCSNKWGTKWGANAKMRRNRSFRDNVLFLKADKSEKGRSFCEGTAVSLEELGFSSANCLSLLFSTSANQTNSGLIDFFKAARLLMWFISFLSFSISQSHIFSGTWNFNLINNGRRIIFKIMYFHFFFYFFWKQPFNFSLPHWQ